MDYLKNILISARPRQWLKNLALLAAPFFGHELFNRGVPLKMGEAVLVFILLSSATYLINDVVDRDKDREHPTKRNRPVASGKLPVAMALLAATVLVGGALYYAYSNFNQYFFGISLAFILLQITYSLWIRNVIIVDALWVAVAFVLRVYAGAFVLPTPTSSWLVLAVIGLSLLLAFGKRRSEHTLLSSLHKRLITRVTLRQYPDTLLDSTIAMSAAYTTLAYSIFAFQTSPVGSSALAEFLPSTLSSPKWMLLTVPLVLYGVSRYLFVIYEKKEGESPEKVLLTDIPLLGTVLLWILATFAIVYAL